MKIRTTYSSWWWESDDQDYPCEENGWINEEGEEFDTLAEAVDWLRDNGAVHPSSCPWSEGTWYSTEAEQDIKTGKYEERSFHLNGFTASQEWKIYRLLCERCAWTPNFNRRSTVA